MSATQTTISSDRQSPALVSLRSQSHVHAWIAGQAAGGAAPPNWLDLYDTLLEEQDPTGKPRWNWRQALYIAWSATPRAKRWPRNLTELASFLGLSDTSTFRHWRRRNPQIKQRIADLPRDALFDHMADVFDAMLIVAESPDPRGNPDRQLFLKVIGLLQSQIQLAGQLDLDHQGHLQHEFDLSRLSDAELAALDGLAERISRDPAGTDPAQQNQPA